jgi:hypothetical protein
MMADSITNAFSMLSSKNNDTLKDQKKALKWLKSSRISENARARKTATKYIFENPSQASLLMSQDEDLRMETLLYLIDETEAFLPELLL